MAAKPPAPLPVRLAHEALELLRAEDPPQAAAVARLLPAFALQLEKRGQEVSAEILLAHARQGAAHIDSLRQLQQQALSYASIAARLKPAKPDDGKDEDAEDEAAKAANRRRNEGLKQVLAAGGEDRVQACLRQGGWAADVSGFTGALLWAARNGFPDTVRLALDLGADINGKCDGEAALSLAAAYGHMDVCRLLLERRAPVHREDLTAAASAGNTELCRLLLAHGAKVDQRNAKGETPLTEAVFMEHEDTVRLLLAHGASVDFASRANYQKGQTALMVAAQAGNAGLCRLMLDRGARVDHRDAEGKTALFRAAGRGRTDICALLLDHGARPNVRDKAGETILGEVAGGPDKYADTCALLLRRGAPPEQKGFRYGELRTPLEQAAAFGHYETFRVLLAAGADATSDWYVPQALAHVESRTRLWQDAVHRAPPPGLLGCDPRFFHENAFAAARTMLLAEGLRDGEAEAPAFAAAALLGTEQRLLQYLDRWGAPGPAPFYTLIESIVLPGASWDRAWEQDSMPAGEKPDLKAWGDAVLKCGPDLGRLFKLSDRLPRPAKSADGETWSLQKTRELAAVIAYKRGAENPPLAVLCYAHNVNDDRFHAALSLVRRQAEGGEQGRNIPDVLVPGEAFDMPGAVFRRLPSGDIRGLFLGELTDCCQSIGSTGDPCVRHGFLSPDGGFYVVEKAGEILGESWAWRGKKGELVLDSLETLSDRVKPGQWKKLCDAFAAALAVAPGDVTALHIGTGGGTPQSLAAAFNPAAAAPKKYRGYRDSHKQVSVWQKPGRAGGKTVQGPQAC
jgi:ankyrin repeat protein